MQEEYGKGIEDFVKLTYYRNFYWICMEVNTNII